MAGEKDRSEGAQVGTCCRSLAAGLYPVHVTALEQARSYLAQRWGRKVSRAEVFQIAVELLYEEVFFPNQFDRAAARLGGDAWLKPRRDCPACGRLVRSGRVRCAACTGYLCRQLDDGKLVVDPGGDYDTVDLTGPELVACPVDPQVPTMKCPLCSKTCAGLWRCSKCGVVSCLECARLERCHMLPVPK